MTRPEGEAGDAPISLATEPGVLGATSVSLQLSPSNKATAMPVRMGMRMRRAPSPNARSGIEQEARQSKHEVVREMEINRATQASPFGLPGTGYVKNNLF